MRILDTKLNLTVDQLGIVIS
uniref:Uncharacterized protein n=1 Tax=Anguilla anguilla TaxID=7936 RepID=A0A0E9USS9_ANGAN